MKTRNILIAASAAAAILATTTVVAWPTAPSYTAGAIAAQAPVGVAAAHFRGGWRRGGHRRGFDAICSERRNEGIEHGLAFVEGFVNFTPEQTTAWNELGAAIRAGSASVGEKCKELKAAGEPRTAPERLARFEAMATTGVGILKRIRPAFDRFYATLSDKQKQALDGLTSRHGGRR
jgi:hypothetical protein